MTKRIKQICTDMLVIAIVLIGVVGTMGSWELGHIGFSRMLLQSLFFVALARAAYLCLQPARPAKRPSQRTRKMPAMPMHTPARHAA